VAILGLVRNVTDAAFLRAVLGDGSTRVRLNPSPPLPLERVPLQPAEGFLISRADGTLSLREIAVTSPLPPEETDRALCALILAGFLELDAVEGEPATPEAPSVSASDSAGGTEPSRPARTEPARGEPARREHARKAPAPPAPRRPAGPVEEMLERYSALPGQNLYQVLGLTAAASESDVRHAYYSLAKKLHPDKFSEDETKNRAERLFAAITEAYATLSRAERRSEYDNSLSQASDKPPAESTAASATAMARQNYLHGRALYEKQEMVKALTFFEHAVEQDEGKEEHHRYLALVQSRNPRLRKEAGRHFLRAIELNPTRADNYAHLGVLYRKMGQEEKGLEYLQKALSWDASNEIARSALGSDEEKKGILKGLFGK
jgi:curved DNA-binding protein CbpA